MKFMCIFRETKTKSMANGYEDQEEECSKKWSKKILSVIAITLKLGKERSLNALTYYNEAKTNLN